MTLLLSDTNHLIFCKLVKEKEKKKKLDDTKKKLNLSFQLRKKVKSETRMGKINLIRKVLITCKFDLAPGFLIYIRSNLCNQMCKS